MLELFQFSLLDMTPYSRQAYFDMIGLYNHAVWPAQIPALVLGLWLVYFAGRQNARGIFVGLGVAWLWCGWVFQMQYYATLNWAGDMFAYLFLAQGGLLIAAGVLAKKPQWITTRTTRVYAGRSLLVFAILFYPPAGLLEDRTFPQLELFGLAPAPTLLTTFAILLLVGGPLRYGLAVIPVLWSCIAVGFAWTLGLFEAYAIFAGLLVCLAGLGMGSQGERI